MRNISEIIERFQDRQAQAFGATVTYTRMGGSVTLSNVQATIGLTEFPLDSGDPMIAAFQAGGFQVKQQYRDFLVKVSDLKDSGGTLFEPQRGDTIAEGGFTYTAMIEGTNYPPWKYSDTSRKVYRIRAKRTK